MTSGRGGCAGESPPGVGANRLKRRVATFLTTPRFAMKLRTVSHGVGCTGSNKAKEKEHRVMPRGASPKREREYKQIEKKFEKSGRYRGREKEVAARIVNKQRARFGETKGSKKKTTRKQLARGRLKTGRQRTSSRR